MDKKQVLNDIVEKTRTAKEYLKSAGKSAKSVGDKSGAAELEKVAGEVERVEKKFDNFRQGNNS